MLDKVNVEYIQSGQMWFIQYQHEFVGGRYDSQEVAMFAVENLSLPDMDEVWMIKCSNNPGVTGGEILLSQDDVNEFIEAKISRLHSEGNIS